MDIVITFLKPSKFYINVDVSSKESMTCHEHIWQSGRSEVAAVYGNVQYRSAKKITHPGTWFDQMCEGDRCLSHESNSLM